MGRYYLDANYNVNGEYLCSKTRLRSCCIATFVLALCISQQSAKALYTNSESSTIVEYQKSSNNETKLEGLSDLNSEAFKLSDTRLCDICDCRSLKKSLNALSVDCHSRNLTALPDILPPNTKVLNLTNNRIKSLSLPRNSKNWENVTYVYLENNIISTFPPLDRNTQYMRNLAALDIRRNKFQGFPTHLFEQFINLDQVHLSNNPWLCDCESTFAFQEWLQRQFHKVGDKEDIRCGSSGSDTNGFKSINLEQRLSSRVIYRLSKSELCPPDGLEEPWDWLDAVNWALGILIVLILAKLILDYIYQHKTKRLPHFFRLNF